MSAFCAPCSCQRCASAALCTMTETAICMPEAPALNERQIAWAKQHDWFLDVNNAGHLVVMSRWSQDGEYHEERVVWTAGYRALRDWAGY